MYCLDQQLYELAASIDSALGHPAIADFHYPSALNPESLRGDFCVVRLAGGGSGMSYTLPESRAATANRNELPQPGDRAIDWLQRFIEPLNGSVSPQRCAALATINALYNALLRRSQTLLPDANNSFCLSDVKSGDKVGMIGFFPPLVKRLRGLGVNLTVIELRRELEREHPGLLVTTDRRKLAPCEKILCTSTTLLNQTLPDMIATAENAQEFALLGPSAGCPPEPLFALGVNTLASAQIADDELLWQRLKAGERLSEARRKCTLTAQNTPSTATLIASLQLASR